MTALLPSSRRLYRRPDRALVGGVAAGIAAHVGLDTRLVRIMLVALALFGGFGVALYGVFWIVLPTAPDAGPGRIPAWLEYLLGAVATIAAVSVVALYTPSGEWAAPMLVAGLGGALLWRQASETERDRWRRLSRSSLSARGTDRIGRIRTVAGAALVLGGAVLLLARTDVSAVQDGLLAVVVTVIGLGLITGPWWLRLATQLGLERSERIRSQERAEIAARVHDSVLQTLALIQRNANSPREVTRLARGQEHELRELLYGPRTATGDLAATLRAAAAEVEDAYGITIEVVVVGDAPLDEGLAAASAAAREALTNAAKHAGVAHVDLFAEVEAQSVSIYVRDRGVGFTLSSVAGDRQGVRGSMIGRVQRHGGTVTVRSAEGAGTEVQIVLPRGGA